MIHLNSLKATLTLEDLVRPTSLEKRDYVILNLFAPLCVSVVAIYNAENSTGNRKPVGKHVLHNFKSAVRMLVTSI